MILHHFTCAEHLDSILESGLSKGDVPTSMTGGLNGVWFTTYETPEGHGLGEERLLSREERQKIERMTGTKCPDGVRYANKKAVRITTVIPSSDKRLVSWSKWSRKRCEPGFRAALNGSGHAHKSWFIYFGLVAVSRFTAIQVQGRSLDLGPFEPEYRYQAIKSFNEDPVKLAA